MKFGRRSKRSKEKIDVSLLSIAFALNLFCLISAEGPPRKTIADRESINFAEVNKTAVLKCPVEMKPKTYIEWYKNNVSLYMESGYKMTRKGLLTIKTVTKGHAGIFTCDAINGFGTTRINVLLIVDDPEEENTNNTPLNPNAANRNFGYPPVISKRPSRIIEEIGGQTSLHCIATAKPKPHIFWLKNGQLIEDTESYFSKDRTHSTLKLTDLKKSDTGTYKCIARNKVDEDTMDFTLEVTDPCPPPEIKSVEPPSAVINEGRAAIFLCEVSSKPGLKLHVKWLKRLNKEETKTSLFHLEGVSYRALNISFSDGTDTYEGLYRSKLLIRNARIQDSGTYVCLALNDKGFSFKNVTLTVESRVMSSNSLGMKVGAGHATNFTLTIALVVILAIVAVITISLCRKGRFFSEQKKAPTTPIVENTYKSLGRSNTEIKNCSSKDYSLCIETADPPSKSRQSLLQNPMNVSL
ncbi:fibroblast growth factor receptor-like 1 [Stegodyphus dumicola]|uniref:fibroblast growth factor receptor-like 1 n=1 Tax=Stegodyphus dumicola TaxID=202533 RepID=UPI0015B1D6DF|nr:fibroblast growth factor receptor-like 1 [Stegodyphus dumicola]